ncbi:MAG: tol-pal system protein YbgF [Gammaproteobacteria bacterium]|nr:tol-pal system protein YbgF [Gammaproteobacteria bacterium]
MKKIVSGLFLGLMITSVFADAPVVDYSTSIGKESAQSFPAQTTEGFSAPAATRTNFSVEQRINRLEQQVNNINGQNLSSKIEELQQNLQRLNGQLESQTHQIEQLNTQIKEFYQDLNRRLETNKPGVPKATVAPDSIAAASVASVNSSSSLMQDATIVPATASNVAGAFAGNELEKNDSLQPAPATADNAFLKEQQMYQAAIDLLPDKKHESVNELRDYLKKYPKGVYVANAHYWLGEINFLQKNYDAAEEEFKVVVDKYSKSKRVADAMLKLALVHQNQGRDEQAKKELNKVIKIYPKTSAAQLAKQQLVGN